MANDKLNDALEWAMTALQQTNFNTKIVVQTPWSNVLEINTGDEIVFLKQTPIDLFLEAEIIKLLYASGIKTIPQIIDDNKNEHCFLMTKCGDVTLRDYFDGKLQIDVLKLVCCRAVIAHSRASFNLSLAILFCYPNKMLRKLKYIVSLCGFSICSHNILLPILFPVMTSFYRPNLQ